MSQPSVSIEFFPPRDAESRSRLLSNVVPKLADLGPEFFSVTYGAGGSTRDGTRQTVTALHEAGQVGVPHLSMGADDLESVHALLDDYKAAGVQHIVALRGDQPSGLGSYRFNNAEALIKVIKAHSGDQFELIVAAYPEVHPDAKSASSDLDFFQAKVEAGASRAITQYFYNVDAYEDFVNRARQRGLSLPIVPGIMPITNLESLARFSDRCGAEIPRWLTQRLSELQDDEEGTKAFGIEYLTQMCQKLVSLGAPGFHFYTLNRWGAASRICEGLGLGSGA